MDNKVYKVHVIDDQMYIRKLFQLGLPQNRFITEVFESGPEYMKFIKIEQKNGVPDIILLDIMMPEMNGFEILESIKKDSLLKNVPVIIISARNQKDDVFKALKLGAFDFIVKPFDIDAIIKKIEMIKK